MLKIDQIKTETPKSETATTARDATKDAGRVHVGAGMLRFDDIKDAGRVHLGAGMLRF